MNVSPGPPCTTRKSNLHRCPTSIQTAGTRRVRSLNSAGQAGSNEKHRNFAGGHTLTTKSCTGGCLPHNPCPRRIAIFGGSRAGHSDARAPSLRSRDMHFSSNPAGSVVLAFSSHSEYGRRHGGCAKAAAKAGSPGVLQLQSSQASLHQRIAFLWPVHQVRELYRENFHPRADTILIDSSSSAITTMEQQTILSSGRLLPHMLIAPDPRLVVAALSPNSRRRQISWHLSHQDSRRRPLVSKAISPARSWKSLMQMNKMSVR